MRQPDRKPRVRDTVFMSGWLFADLLLALAILFLAANTIGIKIPPPPPPKLAITPTRLDPTSPNCKGGTSQPQCTVTLTETADSQGDVNWTTQSDISTGVVFTPSNGLLTPGKSINIQISHLPCENNSLTFSGSRGAIPVRLLWQCTPKQERLDFNYQKMTFSDVNYNGLLNNSSQAISDLKHEIEGQSILKGRNVGLAIVYGGALNPNDATQAQTIGRKVVSILQSMVNDGFQAFKRASYYGNLYNIDTQPSTVEIDVYLFIET